MNRQDFLDWKRHPVTQQVMGQLQARIEELKDELVGQAQFGNAVLQSFKAGAINAYQDIVLIEYEGETHAD